MAAYTNFYEVKINNNCMNNVILTAMNMVHLNENDTINDLIRKMYSDENRKTTMKIHVPSSDINRI